MVCSVTYVQIHVIFYQGTQDIVDSGKIVEGRLDRFQGTKKVLYIHISIPFQPTVARLIFVLVELERDIPVLLVHQAQNTAIITWHASYMVATFFVTDAKTRNIEKFALQSDIR
jgi:hypothetical protein